MCWPIPRNRPRATVPISRRRWSIAACRTSSRASTKSRAGATCCRPGEQQRLAFAQALLFGPDVLFMDEATSALDNATEAHLIELLKSRLPRCTLVSVAHRTTLDAFHDRQLNLTVPAPAG